MYSRLSGNCGYTDMFLFKPLQSRPPCCKHFSSAGCYGSIVIAMTDPWTRCNVICDFRRTVTFPVAFHRDPLLIFNYWLWRSSLQTNPSGAWFRSVRFEPTYKVHAVYTVPVRHADAPVGRFHGLRVIRIWAVLMSAFQIQAIKLLPKSQMELKRGESWELPITQHVTYRMSVGNVNPSERTPRFYTFINIWRWFVHLGQGRSLFRAHRAWRTWEYTLDGTPVPTNSHLH